MSINVGAVGGNFINSTASTKKFTQKQVDAITEIQIKLMQESYTAMIKSSTNVGVGATKWCNEFLPADKSLRMGGMMRSFLTKNAIANKTALKLAQWGAG
jgi:hypothetical protein